jgi:ferredoxin
MSMPALAKDDIRAQAQACGFDLIGFASTERLDSRLPVEDRPGTISTTLKTLLVLGKHIANGVSGALDRRQKQFSCGQLAQVMETAGRELGYWLERNGAMAATLPALFVDFTRELSAAGNTPAGQGSRLLRAAAVESGLGTWGLNNAVLTPQYGPRVYFGGLLTNLALGHDSPLAQELCLGLEACGRCAAICPEKAIPLRAAAGADLGAVRGLDAAACLKSAHPFGPDAFVEHFKATFAARGSAQQQLIASAATRELWQGLSVLRQGAFTGCMECLQVCPVGADSAAVQASVHRKQDFPAGIVFHRTAGSVAVEPVGPQWRRHT